MKHFTIGIVCSGNTCRSPITEAWLREIAPSHAKLWTAGINASPESKKTRVGDEPLSVAGRMGLSQDQICKLRSHRARSIKKEHRKTDLLVWITEPKMINEKYGKSTRAGFMRKKAKNLGAVLLVIPEEDAGFKAKAANAPPWEVVEAYYQQARSLRRWATIIQSFIPGP